MADDDKNKTVKIDDKQLEWFGQKLQQLSKDVDSLTSHIKSLIATPGSSSYAKALKERFDIRKQELEEAVAHLSGVLMDIGIALVDLAEKYRYTEDLQKEDAARLDDLIQSVGNYYPGLTPGYDNYNNDDNDDNDNDNDKTTNKAK